MSLGHNAMEKEVFATLQSLQNCLKQNIYFRFQNVLCSLNPSRSVGPSNIPTKIIKLFKDEILSHLSDIYCSVTGLHHIT